MVDKQIIKCRKKRKLKKAAAKAEADRLIKKTGVNDIHAYKCPVCQWWHVGRRRKGRNDTMKTYHVCKAGPIGSCEVESVALIIDKMLPKYQEHLTIEDAGKVYSDQAKIIHNALLKSLPQGTKHQLLILMLQNHENLYRGI